MDKVYAVEFTLVNWDKKSMIPVSPFNPKAKKVVPMHFAVKFAQMYLDDQVDYFWDEEFWHWDKTGDLNCKFYLKTKDDYKKFLDIKDTHETVGMGMYIKSHIKDSNLRACRFIVETYGG